MTRYVQDRRRIWRKFIELAKRGDPWAVKEYFARRWPQSRERVQVGPDIAQRIYAARDRLKAKGVEVVVRNYTGLSPEERDAVNAIRAKRGEESLPPSGESRPNAPNGVNGKHEDSNSPPELEAVAPQPKPATPMIRRPRGTRSKVAVL